MKKATFIKQLEGFRGEARLYQMEPPHEGKTYVVVSAIRRAFDTGRPETYLFPATADGEVSSYLEMRGSFRGAFDHEEALRRAGYEVSS